MNEILIGSQPHTNQKKIRSVLTTHMYLMACYK